MRFVTFNVNGLRACIAKGFFDFFAAEDADIFAVQETKLQPEQIEIELADHAVYFNSAVKKGYSGTAVFTKKEPISVRYGIGVEEHDNEGRVITCEFEKFFFVDVYTPNSQRELLRLEYRMKWEDAFLCYLKKLDAEKPVIVCGDMNVAHEEIDLKNPKSNRRNAGFTDEERECMTRLLSSGFTDTFRLLYPDRKDAYTWWSYMANARARNIGWRIDYFLCSNRIAEAIVDCEILADVTGSDHCPVRLTVDEEKLK